MKKRTRKGIVLPLLLLLLTGCQSGESQESQMSDDPNFIPRMISPIGAPSITLFNYANDTRFETNSDVAQVKNAFMTNLYDVIIMDHTVGIQQIMTNGAPFQLARIITKGNYYLVGIDKEAAASPQEGDLVVSFGQTTGIPNQILHKLYPNISQTTYYVDSVTAAASVLKTGKYDTQDVDYVLMAQPALYSVLQSSGYTTFGKLSTQINIQEAWRNLSSMDGFPQAGIFIRTSTYQNYPTAITSFFNQYDDAIDTCISDPESVIASLEQYGTTTQQTVRFGMNQTIFEAMQTNQQNLLGLTVGEVDIDAFRSFMGELTIYPSTIYADFYK